MTQRCSQANNDGFAGTFHTVGAINYKSEPSNYRYPVKVLKLSADPAFGRELDQGKLPEALQQQLAQKGIGVSMNSQVSAVTPGEEWQLVDTNTVTHVAVTLDLKIENSQLNAYLELLLFDAGGNRLDIPFDVLVNRVDIAANTSNQQVGAEPQTPVFVAEKGMPVRFRWLYPGGDGEEGRVLAIHGHPWQEEPFVDGSTRLGDNRLSQVMGAELIVPYQPINMLLGSAGGPLGVTGDYLYGTLYDERLGLWGLFRVTEPGKDAPVIHQANVSADGVLRVAGVNTVVPRTGEFAESVTIYTEGRDGVRKLAGTVPVDQHAGTWVFSKPDVELKPGACLRAVSTGGGVYPPESFSALPIEFPGPVSGVDVAEVKSTR